MNDDTQVIVSAQDILASIGFEAQRIVAAVSQHAAGYPFPQPATLQQVIERMANLNATLLQFGPLLGSERNAGIAAQSGLKVELD